MPPVVPRSLGLNDKVNISLAVLASLVAILTALLAWASYRLQRRGPNMRGDEFKL